MGPLLLTAIVIVIAIVWIRGTRRNRERWLNQLSLVGTWDLDAHMILFLETSPTVLTFKLVFHHTFIGIYRA